METFKAFYRDLSSSLESNKSLTPEDQKMICMQLFIFEGVIEEFQSLSQERDDLRIQNRKLVDKGKVRVSQPHNLHSNMDEVKRLQDKIKILEDEVHCLQKTQLELDNLKQVHSSLSEHLHSLSELSAKKDIHIQQLENNISNQDKLISNLRTEMKVLGKKSVSDTLESVDMDKIQSAGRLSFLLPLNSDHSVWIQFRKEKQWVQCSNCGSRGRPKSRCSCLDMAGLQDFSSKAKVYYQRSANPVLGHMGKKFTGSIKKDVILEEPLHQHGKANVHLDPSKHLTPVNSNIMDVVTSSSSSSSSVSSKNFRGGKIDNLVDGTGEENKLMLKRSRFESRVRPLDQNRHNMKIKLRRSRRTKPMEVFSSLLFPNENSKRLKQASGRSDSPFHSRSLPPGSSLLSW